MQNVLNLGTEGRRLGIKLDPSSVITEFISFRAIDLKEIITLGHKKQKNYDLNIKKIKKFDIICPEKEIRTSENNVFVNLISK